MKETKIEINGKFYDMTYLIQGDETIMKVYSGSIYLDNELDYTITVHGGKIIMQTPTNIKKEFFDHVYSTILKAELA